MKTIEIKNVVFLVDDDDYDKCLSLKWCVNNKGYATASLCSGFRGGEVTSMQALIYGEAAHGFDIHHKDGNPRNNQKQNLTLMSKSMHQMQKKIQRNNNSGFKGVCFAKNHGKWKASLTVNGKNKHIGYFETAEDAAKAYDKKAIYYNGRNIFLNFAV